MIDAAIAEVSGRRGQRLMQKFASLGDIALAVGIGEQPIVTDAVKAGRQHSAIHRLRTGATPYRASGLVPGSISDPRRSV